MSDAPLCDAVLSTPIEVPPGLGSALRNVERAARMARARLQQVAETGHPIPAVEDALGRLHVFLGDERRSPFRRALRRPLRQISLGTPAWRRLESAWRAVVLRADAAARLQAAVEELRGDVARITARFGAELPYWTRHHLELEKVTAADVEGLRREDARKALRERLRRVEGELERLRSHLPPAHHLHSVQLADAWPDDVAPGELLGAAMLRLAERAAGRTAAGQTVRVRAAAARHLRELGAAAGWERIASQAAHSTAEQLANAALSAGGEVAWLDDAPLWSGLVASAGDALHDPPRRDGWQPQLLMGDAGTEGDAWGATHFAIPLSPDYVLLTPETPSAVRVYSRRVALGTGVECVAFSCPAGFETVDDARRDVDPLFAGFTAEPAWYRTVRRARLTVLARSGVLWLARLDERGELDRAPTAAWSTGAPRDARLRVLLDGVSASPPRPIAVGAVGAAGGDAVAFGGVSLREVEAPFAACRRAWLKTAATDGDEDRVAAEHEFFRQAARHAGGVGLRPLGRGRLERPAADGYLYAPPFAFSDAGSPPLGRWMAAKPVMFACAAARLCAALTRMGWGLGVFHRAALAFRVEWSPEGLARPVAVVTMAPFAVPLGHYHARTREAAASIPELPGLGLPLLHPMVMEGGLAMPETEAQAWALFALDLLARKRLPSGTRSLEEVARIATESPGDYFTVPQAAARFGAALVDGARARALAESLARVGEERSPPG